MHGMVGAQGWCGHPPAPESVLTKLTRALEVPRSEPSRCGGQGQVSPSRGGALRG